MLNDSLCQLDVSQNRIHGGKMRMKGSSRTRVMKSSGGKSTKSSYLSKSKYTLIENDSSKSESQPGKILLEYKCKRIWF
jgi:hypothetical protein